MNKRDPIQIFRAGRHRASDGRTLSFSQADVEAIAVGYDPALHEAPIVVGHPTTDAPAYGWVERLDADGGALAATPRQIDPAFAELVKAGRFRHVSASFYLPGTTANPKPEAHYLRHVGFLGAQPPAVKGLKPAAFADDEDEDGVVTVEFSDMGAAFRDQSIAQILRRLRDFLIEKFSIEDADKAIPDFSISSINDGATRVIATKNNDLSAPPGADFTEQQEDLMSEQAQAAAAEQQRDLDARAGELEKKAKELEAQGAAFAEREAKARRGEHTAFLDELIKEGRLAPGVKAGALDFMDRLDHGATVSFGEADAQTPLAWFKGLLARSGQVVNFTEASAEDGDKLGDEDKAQQLARLAVEFADKERVAGRIVTMTDAVRHVEKELKS